MSLNIRDAQKIFTKHVLKRVRCLIIKLNTEFLYLLNKKKVILKIKIIMTKIKLFEPVYNYFLSLR